MVVSGLIRKAVNLGSFRRRLVLSGVGVGKGFVFGLEEILIVLFLG